MLENRTTLAPAYKGLQYDHIVERFQEVQEVLAQPEFVARDFVRVCRLLDKNISSIGDYTGRRTDWRSYNIYRFEAPDGNQYSVQGFTRHVEYTGRKPEDDSMAEGMIKISHKEGYTETVLWEMDKLHDKLRAKRPHDPLGPTPPFVIFEGSVKPSDATPLQSPVLGDVSPFEENQKFKRQVEITPEQARIYCRRVFDQLLTYHK